MFEIGALVVTTVNIPGRSPKDKSIVDTDGVHEIAWGKAQTYFKRKYNAIKEKMVKYLNGKEVFIFDGWCRCR